MLLHKRRCPGALETELHNELEGIWTGTSINHHYETYWPDTKAAHVDFGSGFTGGPASAVAEISPPPWPLSAPWGAWKEGQQESQHCLLFVLFHRTQGWIELRGWINASFPNNCHWKAKERQEPWIFLPRNFKWDLSSLEMMTSSGKKLVSPEVLLEQSSRMR